MRSICIAVVLSLMGVVVADAQAPKPAEKTPDAVVVSTADYDELERIFDQIEKARVDEQNAVVAARGAQAVRIALEQSYESARLRALMRLGIKDPATPIAPEPVKELPKPK